MRLFSPASRFLALLLPLSFAAAPHSPGARMEAFEIPGDTLKDNPLRDPVRRWVALVLPEKPQAVERLVFYLPGYGGSSEDALRDRVTFPRLVDQLAAEGLALGIVVVDCRNRWGGSQYLNSPAQGKYADYVCNEIVPLVESRLGLKLNAGQRVVAGHSSGGYGAVMLGMQRRDLFGHVVAIAPDGDFEVTCRDWFVDPQLTRLTEADIAAIQNGPRSVAQSKGGLVELVAGLSAAFAPVGPQAPGKSQWILDGRGQLRQDVWEQWLQVDPLRILRKNPDAFGATQNVYLEGTAQDSLLNNIAARNMYEALRRRPGRSAHHEPPGGHNHAVPERLGRGLEWTFNKPMREIPLPGSR